MVLALPILEDKTEDHRSNYDRKGEQIYRKMTVSLLEEYMAMLEHRNAVQDPELHEMPAVAFEFILVI